MSDDFHARYSPSQLPRIINCPGSTTVHVSQPSSAYAIEGTKCHEIVAYHLINEIRDVDPVSLETFDACDRTELGDAIQDCMDYAFDLISKYPKGSVLIESPISLAGFSDTFGCAELSEVAGTSDFILYSVSDRVIHDIDWKFGKGIEVYPDSEQLLGYGGGSIKNPSLARKYDEVHLHIGQPRLYTGEPFKQHIVTVPDLLSWIGDVLVPALQEANSLNPRFNPSEKACRWCSAKATCGARYDQAMKTASDVFRIYSELPTIKNPDELSEFLSRARNLASYIKAIEKYLARTLMSGQQVKGFKMVAGRSNRKWVDEKAFVKWAAENYPDAEIFEPSLITPAKAEKLFKRKIASTEEFQNLILKPPGKHTLVLDKDPREAISYENASDVFADFAEDDDTED